MVNVNRRSFLSGAAVIAATSIASGQEPTEGVCVTTETLPEFIKGFGYEPIDDGGGYFRFKVVHDGQTFEPSFVISKSKKRLYIVLFAGKVSNTAMAVMRTLLVENNYVGPSGIYLCDCAKCAAGDETSVYVHATLQNQWLRPFEVRESIDSVLNACVRVQAILEPQG